MNTKIYSLRGYDQFDSAYWGLGSCSNGKLYFGLCSHVPSKSAGFFSFNPATERITHEWNVSDILKPAQNTQLQGKIHTPITEGSDGSMYFGTHFAYPYGIPQAMDYEGGHFLAYNPKNGTVTDFGIAHPHEGIITFALDTQRMQAYILTIPSGYLVRCNINTKKWYALGKIPTHGSICRSIAIDSRGDVYGSYEDNGLFVYNRQKAKLEFYDNFFPERAANDWNSASRGGVNKLGRTVWRNIEYDAQRDLFHGVLASNSQVFTLDPTTKQLTIGESFLPKQFKQFQGDLYPTLSLTANKESLFYAPAAGCFDYCRSEKLDDWTHLLSFNKHNQQQTDHGVLADGNKKVFGVAGAVRHNDSLYFLGATQAERSTSASELHKIDGQPFQLSLIKVQL